MIVSALLAFGGQIWVCRPLIDDYFPTKDDLALEATSTPLGGPVNPWHWLTQGFHGFFAAYPEWGSLNTDYWRPLANALFWLHYQMFGSHWSSQLVLGYLAHALVVGMTTYIASTVLRLRPAYVVFAALITLFSPALWSCYGTEQSISSALQYPIYQTELVCALLMLGAFLAFLRKRFALFTILVIVAVSLKETALTVPVSAIALTGFWMAPDRRRSLRNLVLLLTPLAVWGLAWAFVFNYGWGNYTAAPATRSSLLLQPIRNALLWPTDLYVASLLATKQAIATHDWRIILQHGTELAVNTAWWMLIVTALVSAARNYGRRWLVAEPEPWVAALVFALGNLALCIVLQESAPRYGYFWFALGPAALFAVLSRWRTPAPAFALGVGLALSVGVAAPQAIAAAHAFSAQSIAQYRTIKRSARQLTALLATVSPGTTVYLVDDVLVNPTAPQFLQALSGFRGQLILVNSVDPTPGCTPSRPDEGRLGLIRVGAVTTLEYYSPPACFHAAWFPTLPGLVRDSIAQRGLLLSYSFPQITVRTRSLLTNRSEYVFGDHWTVRTAPPACAVEHECTWLGFDGAGPGYYKLDERAR